MTPDMLIVFAVGLGAVVLFATEKAPVDLVGLGVMVALLLTGIVTPDEGIAGFSNTATVTIGAMFVLSAGLFRTGALNFLGRSLVRLGRKTFWLVLLVMMGGIGIVSAFINNTAAVAIFLPIALGVARDLKVSPSKLLMPLSFASMFGGVCTLIGSSTNILVSSIAERHGLPAFGMFEFAPLGLVMFAVGFIYMAVAGIRLIPERRKPGDLVQNFGMGDYLTDFILQPGGKSVGVSIDESPLMLELDLTIINLFRNDKPIRPLSGRTVLLAGDVLRVRCNVEKIKALQEREGILLKSDQKIGDKELKEGDAKLVEAVIAPNSMLEGRTLKGARFYHRFGATALAIRHRGEVMRENLETTVLRAGDVLLLEVQNDLLEDFKDRQAFVTVSDVGLPEFRRKKILPAVLIVAGVVLSAAVGLFPIVVSVITGCVLLVLTKCITLDEAYRAIEWKVIFLLAGVLTLGVALEKTGASDLVSSLLVNTLGGWGPVALVGGFYLLASLLTEMMSNNATAALLAPIAIAAAETMGVDSRPFLMAVTFAASASFMTPVGYQTNTLIYGPGQYKFGDFMRVGAPLNLLFWILATILIPIIWPF